LVGIPRFHGVSQRPGKPFAYWGETEHSPHIFALPGNSLSTLVTFHRYVAPALLQMEGRISVEPIQISIGKEIENFHLTRFLPVKLSSSSSGTLSTPNNSGDFSQLAGTDGFIEIPLGTDHAPNTNFPYYPWL